MFRKASIALLYCVLLFLPSQASAQEGIQQTLERLRPKYPNGDATAAVYLNEVAWIHRAEGIVLLGKAGGHACAQPTTGKMVSCDYLVDSNTKRGWDVIRGDDAGTPQFGGEGEDLTAALAGGSRSLVPPVDPGGSGPGPVDPPSAPGAKGDKGEKGDRGDRGEKGDPGQNADPAVLNDILTRLAALENQVRVLEAKPVPASCSASLNFGAARIPISCKLNP